MTLWIQQLRGIWKAFEALSESLDGNQEKATDVSEGRIQLIRPAYNV